MKNKWTPIFIIALLIAGGLSVVASNKPDGLESSTQSIGLHVTESQFTSLMPDYQILVINNEFLSTILSGIIGTIIIFLLVLLIANLTNKNSKQKKFPNT